jgi:hypothetical protein
MSTAVYSGSWPTIRSVAEIYNRYLYLPEMRVALFCQANRADRGWKREDHM